MNLEQTLIYASEIVAVIRFQWGLMFLMGLWIGSLFFKIIRQNRREDVLRSELSRCKQAVLEEHNKRDLAEKDKKQLRRMMEADAAVLTQTRELVQRQQDKIDSLEVKNAHLEGRS